MTNNVCFEQVPLLGQGVQVLDGLHRFFPADKNLPDRHYVFG